jgi:hypothetical protein
MEGDLGVIRGRMIKTRDWVWMKSEVAFGVLVKAVIESYIDWGSSI